MALHMKGLSYEYIEQDIFNKGELLLEYNPVHRKVPPCRCSSTAASQSASRWPSWNTSTRSGPPRAPRSASSPPNPTSAPSLASGLPMSTTRFLSSQTSVQFFWFQKAGTNVTRSSLHLFSAYVGVNRATTEVERAEKVKETLAVLEQLEGAFVKHSNRKAFFAGDSIGYLDLAVGCHLHWLEAELKMSGVEFLYAGKTPLLAAWAKRFTETEAAKEAVPDTDVVIEYAKKRQAYRAAVAAAAATAK